MIETDEKHPLPHATLKSSSDESGRITRSIVLAHDGSPNADYAFHWLLSNVFRNNDHLILVKIIPDTELSDLFGSGLSDWTDTLKKMAETDVCTTFNSAIRFSPFFGISTYSNLVVHIGQITP